MQKIMASKKISRFDDPVSNTYVVRTPAIAANIAVATAAAIATAIADG